MTPLPTNTQPPSGSGRGARREAALPALGRDDTPFLGNEVNR